MDLKRLFPTIFICAMLCAPASAAALIGEERAMEAVFAHSGADRQTSNITAFSIIDRDGRPAYDVVFDSPLSGYHYVIDAENGEVISFNTVPKSAADAVASSAASHDEPPAQADVPSVPRSAPKYIGPERARQIALSHAKISPSSVHKIEIEMDHDYGVMVYEVDFRSGGWEYEYDIDAVTGRILKWSREWD